MFSLKIYSYWHDLYMYLYIGIFTNDNVTISTRIYLCRYLLIFLWNGLNIYCQLINANKYGALLKWNNNLKLFKLILII